MAAPRSPVNNCGKLSGGGDPDMTPTPSEQAAAVLNLLDSGVIPWDDKSVLVVLRRVLKQASTTSIRKRMKSELQKMYQIAPSGRMAKIERAQIPRIRYELAMQGIKFRQFELEVLARGAVVIFGDKKFHFPIESKWNGFSNEINDCEPHNYEAHIKLK
jgi:hypothetical protein